MVFVQSYRYYGSYFCLKVSLLGAGARDSDVLIEAIRCYYYYDEAGKGHYSFDRTDHKARNHMSTLLRMLS